MSDKEDKGLRGRLWLRIALVASLSVNLLVLGAVAGAFWKWPRGEHLAARHLGSAGLGTIAGAFDDSEKRAIMASFVEHRRKFGSFREEAVADLDGFITILVAEPFDPSALDAHFEDQRERVMIRLKRGQDVVGARIKAMPASARHDFAERVKSRYEEKGKRKSHD